jgi:hypothetical protein
MNVFYYLFVIIVLLSCKSKVPLIDYKGYNDQSLYITGYGTNYKKKDTLAQLLIKIPERLDTFYQWHNSSDCTTCSWEQYRFADSNYPKYLESGFFWNEPFPDSIYQLTIRHKPTRWTPRSVNLKSLSSSDTGYSELPVKEVLCEGSEIISIEYVVINGRPFWITQVSNACSRITEKNQSM